MDAVASECALNFRACTSGWSSRCARHRLRRSAPGPPSACCLRRRADLRYRWCRQWAVWLGSPLQQPRRSRQAPGCVQARSKSGWAVVTHYTSPVGDDGHRRYGTRPALL